MTVLLGKSLRIWPGRIGADVEILGLLAKVEVADAASDEIAGKTGCVEFFRTWRASRSITLSVIGCSPAVKIRGTRFTGLLVGWVGLSVTGAIGVGVDQTAGQNPFPSL